MDNLNAANSDNDLKQPLHDHTREHKQFLEIEIPKSDKQYLLYQNMEDIENANYSGDDVNTTNNTNDNNSGCTKECGKMCCVFLILILLSAFMVFMAYLHN